MGVEYVLSHLHVFSAICPLTALFLIFLCINISSLVFIVWNIETTAIESLYYIAGQWQNGKHWKSLHFFTSIQLMLSP